MFREGKKNGLKVAMRSAFPCSICGEEEQTGQPWKQNAWFPSVKEDKRDTDRKG